jgi:hypothetical protein
VEVSEVPDGRGGELLTSRLRLRARGSARAFFITDEKTIFNLDYTN